MDKAKETNDLVKKIILNGDPEKAVLLLLGWIFSRKEEITKERSEYRASLNAIHKLNQMGRKKSVQEAIDALSETGMR